MNYVDIVLTTDKKFYISKPWSVNAGDMISVTNQAGERVLKTVDEVLTEEAGGGVMAFLERYTGCGLKRIEARYSKVDITWPEEEEEQDVSE